MLSLLFIERLMVSLFLCSVLVVPSLAFGGAYTSSSHGNNEHGVTNNKIEYAIGNCGNCHQQHGCDGGDGGGGTNYLLYSSSNANQSNNFCFKCHVENGSISENPFLNRDYSYRAGGYIDIPVASVLEVFDTNSGSIRSSHGLDDILTFINQKDWNYNLDSNPCVACHDPHQAQGDPAFKSDSVKTAATRGLLVALPSLHGTSEWKPFGATLSTYTSAYQAPYRFGSAMTYEPDGSTTTDGSNLVDYNTFCTDCHNSTNVIESAALGRNLRTIDWGQEKHGKGFAEGSIDVDAPFIAGSGSMGYVLACTDCHEPHGSSNVALIRREVNGSALPSPITTIYAASTIPNQAGTNAEMKSLCNRCHSDDYYTIHHHNNDSPYYQAKRCSNCHQYGPGQPVNCNACHYHGSFRTDCGDGMRTTF